MAEHRTQSGLEIVDHGEFPLDRANHLRAHPQTAGSTQQLEAAMQGVGESAYGEGCQQSDTNMANVANAMSRMSRPGRQQGRVAAPRASFRRDSQETDQRPLARTPQSPGVDSGNRRLGAAKLQVVSAAAIDRATRDARDKHAPMGRAARAVEGLASPGLLTEAAPVFAEPATAVAYGGVLTALPMLLREGLLGAANRLFRLPAGFHGLTTILLFVACMTLARVRTPESLRYQAPGESGAILGLDRGPETKTLRRKLKLLTSAEHTVRDWQSALARTWATEHQDDWATLAVDGHVKVYAGRNGRLPKHFVARQKLCLPASVSYWINALGGTPLLCLHQALDQDVAPHLLQLGVVPEAAPDLTQPEAGAPALTLVFDRAGWSPDLFKRLARRGIACITWHKNFTGEDWPEEDFHPLEVPIHAPAGTSATTVDLAEQPMVLRNGLTVRQIRRRLATGRQVPVITTHPQMPLDQVAGARFSRWSQENFFKYLREQFNLDSLPTHDLAPLDPEAQVVNPVRRALEKTIRRVRSRLAAARNRLAVALQEPHQDTATRLEADAQALDERLEALKRERADTPDPCPRRRPAGAGQAGRPAGWRAPVHGRGADDRLARPDPHDGARDQCPGQETECPQPAARVADLRRQHHSRAGQRNSADPASGPRQRRLRPHARSPDQGTQRNQHDLSRHRTQAGLRGGR